MLLLLSWFASQDGATSGSGKVPADSAQEQPVPNPAQQEQQERQEDLQAHIADEADDNRAAEVDQAAHTSAAAKPNSSTNTMAQPASSAPVASSMQRKLGEALNPTR